MILLLGGTSETAPLATALGGAGLKVLVSTATDVALHVGDHPNVIRRAGVLDCERMHRLVVELDIKLIVDASHPYSAEASENARRTAAELGVSYVRWERPPALERGEPVIFRQSHELAAETACSFGLPVLLTTGSRNLIPYVAAASRAGVELFVRVLPHADSIEVCRSAGIPERNILSGRGPFSVEENVETLRRFHIGVLVTKDSGVAGGVPAKIEAARIHGCRVVVVARPENITHATFSDVRELVSAVCRALSRPSPDLAPST